MKNSSSVTLVLSDEDFIKLKTKLVNGDISGLNIHINEAMFKESPLYIEYIKGKIL